METRANYVVIGTFTLAVIAGVFGFVYWFQNIGGTGERAIYRVQFEGSVSGLRTGGTVLFNGIRVGEVSDLKLDPAKPRQVLATISIDKGVAVRADTKAAMEFQGLTGIAVLTLSGGTPNSPKLVGSTTNPPVIVADSASSADLTQAARETLRHVDEFIAENKQSFHDAIQNIDTFSAALARNSERVDKIMQGLQNLTAGEDGKSGEINDAVKQLKKVADNANKQVSSLGAEAHRTIANINQAVKDFSKNPGKFLFGGSKE